MLDTGAWTVTRLPNRTGIYTNGTALSAVRFLLIHYRKPSRRLGMLTGTRVPGTRIYYPNPGS